MKTLQEAAADILKNSQTSAPADPIKKMPAQVNDLGGSTNENPDGGEVGKKAAAALSKTATPGKPAPVAAEPSKGKLKEEDESDSEELEVVEEDFEEEELSEEETEETVEEELSEEEIAELQQQKLDSIKSKMKELGVQEDIEAIFSGEEVSEDFVKKATVIFESAVISRAVAVVEEMEKEILEAAQESVQEIKEELESRIDNYMDYIAEKWLEENTVAVQSGLRAEIVEDFIKGLHNLFVENYIEVPDEQVDVLESMVDEVAELKEKLNEALNDNIRLSNVINESVRKDILSSVCEGLTATQTEKMKSLAEGVEFTTEGEYKEKLEIIKESYFSNKVSVKSNPLISEDLEEGGVVEEKQIPSIMQHYVKAISRTIK